MLLLGAGVLWNVDSGAAALLAWLAALGYRALFRPTWRARLAAVAGHLAAAAAGLSAASAGYVGLVFLGHGELPDFRGCLHSQRLFYVHGYYMLPMTFPGPWLPVVLVYLAAYARAAAALVARADSPRSALLVLLAVLGSLLFAYYQGRSHTQCLRLAAWPAVFLLTLFLDDLLARLRAGSRRPGEWALAVLLLGAGRAAVFPSLVPAFTLVIGFLLIAELPSTAQFVGLAIVLIGFRLAQKA